MSEIILILLILNFIHGIGTWKLYKVSGNKPFYSFIPVYNVFVLLKIINRPWWWIFIIISTLVDIWISKIVWKYWRCLRDISVLELAELKTRQLKKYYYVYW